MSVPVMNPFKPAPGARPPVLAGRQPLVQLFGRSLDEGPGSPGRIAFITGPRGMGKTVLLTAASDVGEARDWHVINETATPGLVNRVLDQIRHLQQRRRIPGRVIASVNASVLGNGAGVQFAPPQTVALRQALTDHIDSLPSGKGVLLTIDEVHRAAIDDLREISALTQHMIRENREFAVVMAGLPSAISDLLNDDVLTFLRRADHYELGKIDLLEVRDAIVKPIVDNGFQISRTAEQLATLTTDGYPFLIQLIGYHLWDKAEDGFIDDIAADEACKAAIRRLGSLVHDTSLNDLSDVDKTFLLAMSHDDGPSAISDVRARAAMRPQYANTYKQRLIEAGVIYSVRHGVVDFTLPQMREYLREHAASLGVTAPTRLLSTRNPRKPRNS